MRRVVICLLCVGTSMVAVTSGATAAQGRSARPRTHATGRKDHGRTVRHRANRSHSAKRKTPNRPLVTTMATGTVPLLGDQSVESSVDRNAAGVAEAFPFASKATGSAGSISVYID